MISSKGRSGVTLLEAVVALMILSGATLSVLTLFHLGLRHQTQSSQRVLAVSLAEQRIEELRHRARTPAGFRQLRSFSQVYTPDSERPKFRVATRVNEEEIHSPCSAFDQLDDPRLIDASALRLTTYVVWNPNTPGVRLTALVTEPRLEHSNVRWNDIPASLAKDQDVRVSADLLDLSEQPIPGVKFQFWIKPRTSTATLRRARDGRQLNVVNRIDPVDAADLVHYPGGGVILTARARYFGQVLSADSAEIELEN
jgi:type II secretory pathway pseudopilin PulG